MKTTSKVLALVTMLTAASQGATTISGTLGSSFKDNGLATNVISGALVMLVVDTGGAGFLDLASGGAITSGLVGKTGKTITAAQAGLVAGGSFGGDTIVNTSVTGASGSIAGLLPGIDITNYINKNFAVVYFNATPATLATSLEGQFFGMIRLSDWILPSSDSGATFTMSTTDASAGGSYFSTSASTTATQLGTGFFTGSGTAADTGSTAIRGTTFQVAAAVPEPSAALLGAVGVLGLLRRRRI